MLQLSRQDSSVLMDGFPFELDGFDPDLDEITSEVVEPATSAADRSVARRACLQILYELDTTQHEPALVLKVHLAERPEAYAVRQIIRRIVDGVLANKAELDAELQEYRVGLAHRPSGCH